MHSILGNSRKTDLTFFKNGRIDISAHVTKILKLEKGDALDVVAGNGEMYIYVKIHAPTVGRHEAACFPTHERSNHFRAWSLRLCRAMMDLCGCESDKMELSVGSPIELWNGETALPIIYKNILNNGTRD